MNKNTIQLIIIVIVIICFGLAGLGLVIHNIKNDEKHLRLRLEQMEHHHDEEVMDSEMMLETESPKEAEKRPLNPVSRGRIVSPDGGDEPDDSSKEE